MEGTQFITSGYAGVSVDCRGSGLIGQHTGDGVQPVVHFADPIQMGVDHLEAGYLASSDHLGQIIGGPLPEVFSHCSNLNNSVMVTELVVSPEPNLLLWGRGVTLEPLGAQTRRRAGPLGGPPLR